MSANLRELLSRVQTSDSIRLVAVITMDGFLLEASASEGVDAQQVAAAACNGILVARALGGELGQGAFNQALIEYAGGVVFLEPLDEDLGLVVLAPRDVNLGRLRLIMRKYSAAILEATATV